ncbi:hypothetical protein E2542_SST15413 [Spatholobus suberectus]|nr:hypothetical protein E2542_SST15413 [Spatholobus suberectus]
MVSYSKACGVSLRWPLLVRYIPHGSIVITYPVDLHVRFINLLEVPTRALARHFPKARETHGGRGGCCGQSFGREQFFFDDDGPLTSPRCPQWLVLACEYNVRDGRGNGDSDSMVRWEMQQVDVDIWHDLALGQEYIEVSLTSVMLSSE